MNTKKTNKAVRVSNALFWLFSGIITLIGVFLRIQYINRPLEYDEIWTITHYCNKPFYYIFSELSTPNNHPLSTILTKYIMSIYGGSTFDIRLPSLIAGVVTIILVGMLSYRLTKNKFLTITSLIIMALNGALIYYSQAERGYSLQIFFITALICSIVFKETSQSSDSKPIFSIMIFIFVILSIVTIPTSVLYVFPIAVLHLIKLIFYKRSSPILKTLKKEKLTFIAYLISGLLSLAWILVNYAQLKAGQTNGVEIVSLKQFISFSLTTLTSIIPETFIILAIIGILFRKNRLIVIAGIIIILFPLISSIVFKAGFARVYSPSIPVICVTSIISLYSIVNLVKNNLRNILLIIISLVCFITLFINTQKEHNIWFPVDWSSTYSYLNKHLPNTYYIVLPAYAGYPARFNNNDIVLYNMKRASEKDNFLLVISDVGRNPQSIDGMNSIGNTSTFQLPKSNEIYLNKFNVKLCLYNLKQVNSSNICPSPVLILVAPNKHINGELTIPSDIGKSAVLNRWFMYPNYNYYMIFDNHKMSEKNVEYAENTTNNALSFFTILPASDEDIKNLLKLIQQ